MWTIVLTVNVASKRCPGAITERYIHREIFADEISKKEKILTVNDVSF